jgi:hypothetical protein
VPAVVAVGGDAEKLAIEGSEDFTGQGKMKGDNGPRGKSRNAESRNGTARLRDH